MTVPYDRQLQSKVDRCQELLSDFGQLTFLPAQASPEQGFRNKAKMVISGTTDNPTIGILDADGLLPAERFWAIVAETLDDYEAEHPDAARGVSGDVDLRADHFAHSCLNRLQLKNTKQMVDIGNQAESLLYAGTMPNPVAR